MYTQYFGLEEKPFSIAPNPDYLFMSDRHREALNHLTYGLGDTGGFVLLTGEVGTGKTTISRRLMENLPENTQPAFILNPTLSSHELLATICDELKIRYRKTGATLKTLTDKIQQKLIKNHNEDINTLLIIDEAQHLEPEVLEQLRLLTNLETNTKKLLQVILIGQPELQQLLQRRDLRQLAQRITARYHLLPLNKQEVAQYLKHRLSVAKCFRNIFDKGAVAAIHKTCKGIPRLMNLLAERSLMNAYNNNSAVVTRKIVLQAAAEALGDEYLITPWWQSPWLKKAFLSLAFMLILATGVFWGSQQDKLLALFNAVETNQQANNKIDINSEDRQTGQNKAQSSLQNPNNATAAQVTKIAAAPLPATVSDQTEKQQHSQPQTQSQPQPQPKQPPVAKAQTEPLNQKVVNNTIKPQATVSQKQTDKQITKQASNTASEQPRVLGYQAEKYKKQLQHNGESDYQLQSQEGVSEQLLESFQAAIAETQNEDLSSEPMRATVSDYKPLTQMPAWVQDGVPSLTFQTHIYSSDGKGWVKVNDRERYEGDYISGELMLHQILPQHVVLSFRGEKFTMAALSSWN